MTSIKYSILKKTSLLLIAILTTVVVSACGGGGSSDNGAGTEDLTRETSILVLGDSISTGFGIATPWPTLLQSQAGLTVNNSNSVSGEQTSYGLSNIEALLIANNPTHVIILLGTNDAIRGSVSQANSNLSAMVNIANANNVIAVVATLPPVTRSTSENAAAAQISSFIRGLSSDATIVDVRAAFGDGQSLIADGVHPNASGQQLIADEMASVF